MFSSCFVLSNTNIKAFKGVPWIVPRISPFGHTFNSGLMLRVHRSSGAFFFFFFFQGCQVETGNKSLLLTMYAFFASAGAVPEASMVVVMVVRTYTARYCTPTQSTLHMAKLTSKGKSIS